MGIGLWARLALKGPSGNILPDKFKLLFSGGNHVVESGVQDRLENFPIKGAGFEAHSFQVLSPDKRFDIAQVGEIVGYGFFYVFMNGFGHHVQD